MHYIGNGWFYDRFSFFENNPMEWVRNHNYQSAAMLLATCQDCSAFGLLHSRLHTRE